MMVLSGYPLLTSISYPLLKTLIKFIIFFIRNVDPLNKRVFYSTIFFIINCYKVALALVTYAKETKEGASIWLEGNSFSSPFHCKL